MRHLLFLLAAALITTRATAALQVIVEPTTLVTNESGSSVTYRVVLEQPPSAGETVTVSPSSGDVTEGDLDVSADNSFSDSADVTFTNADWSEPKTITVRPGATGDGNDGDVSFTITNTTSATGGNASFNGALTPNVSVTNRNNEGVSSIFMDPPSGGVFYLDEGTSQTVTVSVSGAPTSDISIDLNVAGSEATLSTGTVTLTAGNGYSATFDVTATDDAVSDGDQAFTIVTAPAVSGDVAYNGINTPDIEGQAIDTGPPPEAPTALVPVGLNPGDEFYIIFVGSDAVNGAQTSAVYKAYAATVKAKDPDTDAIDGWQTLFAHDDFTLTTRAAFVTETSQPIYNTNGDKVADNLADFYDGTLDAAIEFDESGAATARGVWTGFDERGRSSGIGDDTLGGTDSLGDACLAGYSNEASRSWAFNSLSGGSGCASANFPLYVLSPLLRVPGFTVTPSAAAGGSITPATAQTVSENDTVAFTVTPDSGFSILSVDGTCGGTLSGNTYTTNAITADCSVAASFSQNTFNIGGSVSGLASGQSVVLQNNGGDDKTVSADGSFTFDTAVLGAYDVTVLTDPAGQACTVTAGNGTATADVTNVAVTCDTAVSEDLSTVTASAPLVVAGNEATLTVTVLDTAGNPVPGLPVSLVVENASIDASLVSIATSPTNTDASGEAAFRVTSSIAQEVEFRATFNPDLFITITWAAAAAPAVPVPTMSNLWLLAVALGVLAFASRRWASNKAQAQN